MVDKKCPLKYFEHCPQLIAECQHKPTPDANEHILQMASFFLNLDKLRFAYYKYDYWKARIFASAIDFH